MSRAVSPHRECNDANYVSSCFPYSTHNFICSILGGSGVNELTRRIHEMWLLSGWQQCEKVLQNTQRPMRKPAFPLPQFQIMNVSLFPTTTTTTNTLKFNTLEEIFFLFFTSYTCFSYWEKPQLNESPSNHLLCLLPGCLSFFFITEFAWFS